MLVDDLLSMDSEIPIEVKEDGNTNLLLKELRELMYFNDGYPPEFERVINGGRISN
jgi:hypothetical protein